MGIVRFVDGTGAVRWGRPLDDRHALPMVGDLFGENRFAEEAVEVVRRLAPVDPPGILAIGRNYREHVREMNAGEIPDEPVVFVKLATSVIGPDDAIVLPLSAPDEVDYEAELAVIIGRTAKDVSEDRAMDAVFGYTCANDVTARDCQKRCDRQWARAKGFDTFCPLGPVVVRRDDLRAVDDRGGRGVGVRSILNGRTMQDGNTSEMIFPVRSLVSFLSRQFTLLPGTVILTGTPPGVGFARSPQVFLRAGDEIGVEIDGIGRLTHRVIAPEP